MRSAHSRAMSTRRGFLAGTSLTASGAAALMLPSVAPALSVRGGLDHARRGTFAALVRTVASSPGTCLEARSAHRLADTLDAHYRSAPDRVRGQVDQILDALDDVPGGSFAALTAARRLERLVTALEEGSSGGLSGHEARDAVALAIAASRRPFRLDPAAAEVWVRVARAARRH